MHSGSRLLPRPLGPTPLGRSETANLRNRDVALGPVYSRGLRRSGNCRAPWTGSSLDSAFRSLIQSGSPLLHGSWPDSLLPDLSGEGTAHSSERELPKMPSFTIMPGGLSAPFLLGPSRSILSMARLSQPRPILHGHFPCGNQVKVVTSSEPSLSDGLQRSSLRSQTTSRALPCPPTFFPLTPVVQPLGLQQGSPHGAQTPFHAPTPQGAGVLTL